MHVKITDDIELYLGDATKIVPTLGELEVIVTDPPYGMNYKSGWRKVKHDIIENDSTTDFLIWATNLKTSNSSYIFGRWENIKEIELPKSVIIWIKNAWGSGDLEHSHGRQTELIFFYPGSNHEWTNKRPRDFIMCPRTDNKLHPTQKPVNLMKELCSYTKGVIVDPFMGSGSTGVAAIQLGRKFIGIEKDEKYFNISVKRITEAKPGLFKK